MAHFQKSEMVGRAHSIRIERKAPLEGWASPSGRGSPRRSRLGYSFACEERKIFSGGDLTIIEKTGTRQAHFKGRAVQPARVLFFLMILTSSGRRSRMCVKVLKAVQHFGRRCSS